MNELFPASNIHHLFLKFDPKFVSEALYQIYHPPSPPPNPPPPPSLQKGDALSIIVIVY